MTQEWIRAGGALFLALIMGVLAVFTRGQPYRRASLGFGALALGLLVVYNLAPVYRFNGLPLAWVALALLVVAMAFYITSWLKGEVLKRHLEMRDQMAAKLKERREATKGKGTSD